ncbi:iron-containing alcohol dehydrogenase [Alicyclobacillus herbarius]|uniref:iron-containing alcohol dehydrogenase n=1 Tax=Alicyclobacillus herbarius TaxID=122960 RepID=UPI000424D286|nr:iron-containing alcohol dehydrogenase [Alicyclobacillus herbarius]
MLSFSYSMHTDIQFGWGASRRLPEWLRAHAAGPRLLLVTDEGVLQAGVVDPVVKGLQTAGYEVVITEERTHRKLTLKHAQLRPRLAVLDAALTLTVRHTA